MENPNVGEAAAGRAAEGLADFRWTAREAKKFLRSAGVDYAAIRTRVVDELWDHLLVGLPKMAERGDVSQAWFAYRVISAKRLGRLKPRPDVLAKVRELAPQAARALWRISLANDPKHRLYKSTPFLKLRRRARTELCRGIGIRITKQLIRVEGSGFVKLLLETMESVPPTLSPEQAGVLAAWADRERGMKFLAEGVRFGAFKIRGQ